MDNEKITVVHGHHARIFILWSGTLVTIIILGVVGYALFLVKSYIVYVGYVWLVSLAVTPTIAITAGIVWLLKYIFHKELDDIGPSGSIVRWMHTVTHIHPQGTQEYRVRERVEKIKIEVPTLLALLKEGILGNNDLLLGYHLEGDARYGTWDDLRSFVIAGKSRSGKTVTMVFYIIQALLGGAKVYVCDPHYNKPTGLLKILEPIKEYLTAARTEDEIVQATQEFRTEMLERKAGKDCSIPNLIVYDEWSEQLRELSEEQVDLVTKTVLNCNEAYAGFNGYAMVGGHEWTARESGGKKGASVRRGFHSVICHRLDDEYAKFLLKNASGKKAALKAPSLPKGQAFFQDSEGELDTIVIPYYGKDKEAVFYVKEMLMQLNAPMKHERIAGSTHKSGPNTEIPLMLSQGIGNCELKTGDWAGSTHEEVASNVNTAIITSSSLPQQEVTDEQFVSVLREIGKKLKAGETPNDIRRSLGITGGRAMQEVNAALQFLQVYAD